jgi:hypothetical protein
MTTMGSDVRFFSTNRVDLIEFAALPAAGAWSDVGETPSVGYNRATLIWEYNEGEQADGGAVDLMVYYSIYSQSADVPAGETEWIPFSAGTGDLVTSGADTEILVQAAYLHFQPTSGDREAVTVDMSWPSYVERIGVRVRESGDAGTPGSCRVAVQLSLEDGPSVPLLLNTTGTEMAVAIADGSDVALGSTTDAAITSDSDGTVIGFLRGLVRWAYERMPTSLGQKTKANSFPVTLASDGDAIEVVGQGLVDSGAVEIIADDEQIDQDDYGKSVQIDFGSTMDGYLTLASLVSVGGDVLTPDGVLLVFDTDPTITAGDTSIAAAERETLIGQWSVYSSDWTSADANAASTCPWPNDALRVEGLSSVYVAWHHLSATSYNSAVGDDETLSVRLVLDRIV